MLAEIAPALLDALPMHAKGRLARVNKRDEAVIKEIAADVLGMLDENYKKSCGEMNGIFGSEQAAKLATSGGTGDPAAHECDELLRVKAEPPRQRHERRHRFFFILQVRGGSADHGDQLLRAESEHCLEPQH